MSSTVSSWTCAELKDSWTCAELKDSDLDTFDKAGDEAKSLGGERIGAVATSVAGVKTGGEVNSGTGGGALFGGEPEDSGFVTKKNSPIDPVLFW